MVLLARPQFVNNILEGLRTITQNSQTGTQGMIEFRSRLKQHFENFSFFPEVVIQLRPQTFHRKLLRECIARFLQDRMLCLQLESKVIEKSIDSINGEPPPFVITFIGRVERFNELKNRFTIYLENFFRQLDSQGSSIALDFTLIGIELHSPNAIVGDERREFVFN